MTARSWQIYGVGFILVVVAAVVALWISPAEAQTRQAARGKQRPVRAEPAKPQESPRPPTPEPIVVEPASRAPRVPSVPPPSRPAPRESVSPRDSGTRITPRPEPTRPTLPPLVQPSPAPSISDPPRSGPVRPPRPTVSPPPKVDRAPAPAPVLVPVVDFAPIDVGLDVPHCEQALVCPLDRWDDLVAWRLVGATGIYYWELVYERLDGWSWYAIMNRLDIDRQVFYDALGVNWSPRGHFRDDDVRMAMVHQTGHHVLPEFSCELPIELPPTRQFPVPADAQDERIARHISEDTLWCFDMLIALYERLHDWGAVARTLYVSPYMFEAVFGVELVVRGDIVEYPSDVDLRFAVLEDSGDEQRASTLGTVAKGLTLVALGVAGVVSGLF